MEIVYYLTFNTNFGVAGLLYTNNPFKLTRIFLPQQNKDRFINDLKKNYCSIEKKNEKANIIAETIINYFEGNNIVIHRQYLDLSNFTKLQQKVYYQTLEIPYGEVRLYAQISQLIGKPKAYRFVGSCMAINPYPVFIPCHRVIRSDGLIGQYSGGNLLKQKMIELEKRI